MTATVDASRTRRRRWVAVLAVLFVTVPIWQWFQTSDVAFRMSRGSLEYALLRDDLGVGIRGVVLVVETKQIEDSTLFATSRGGSGRTDSCTLARAMNLEASGRASCVASTITGSQRPATTTDGQMDLYPAIDIRGGRCVRLHQGDYERETVYDADPVAVAQQFDEAGARWIHVVDLDAARTGEQTSRALIGRIASSVAAHVETGGGVRTERDVDELVDLGLARVVLGTAAMQDPSLVGRCAGKHPGAVAVGLDTRHGEVAVKGWTEGTGEQVVEVLPRFEDAGVAALIVTEISRDATMEGPDVAAYERLLGSTSIPVVASGGVGTLDHLRDLRRLPLEGVIVGKAIYERRFTVEEALAVLDGGPPSSVR